MKLRIPMIVAVRSFAMALKQDTEAKSEKSTDQRTRRKRLKFPSSYTLIFDTETSVDHAQNFRIGTYQVRKGGELVEKGLFYEPAMLTARELCMMQRYAENRGLMLRDRLSFLREVFYRYGYDRGGLVVGFNLPFDLSRLAHEIGTSHGFDMRGGFSLALLPEKWMPNVLVRHLNSRSAFIRFAAAPKAVDGRSLRKNFKTQAKAGYFLDVKTLASALMGGCGGLGDLAKALGVTQKLETGEHGGPLTEMYLDYAANDTQTTWECFQSLMVKYREHGLADTPPQRIYSEASLGKAYLKQMQITPWRKMQDDFEPEILGIIMHTYYGGRAEIRIRRQNVRVLYCDFRSMYPTVCTLMGLWKFVIASGIDYTDWTEQTRDLLDTATLADLQQPEFWQKLHVLVEVAPDADIYPVRSHYGENSRTIGLNGLTSSRGHWYTLADCIASKLHSGKAPQILRALQFTPREPQQGLKPIIIGGRDAYRIDPYQDDFYKRVIELRGQIQSQEKQAKKDGNTVQADQLSAYSQMLKLLANSTSYGIFAEMNVQSYNRPRKVRVFGAECSPFDADSKSVEEAGTEFHPLLATLITGAARLMLGTAEKLALGNGIGWALCDTDSLALARPEGMADSEFLAKAETVTGWFDGLNQYDDGKPLFKVEDQNYRIKDGQLLVEQHEPLYAIAISAKRYVLFNLGPNGRPIIRKALAHGLGHLLAPYQDPEAPSEIPAPTLCDSEKGKRLKATAIGVDRWQYDVWYQIIVAELDGHPDEVDLSVLKHLDRKAASRYSASTSSLLHWFDPYNEGKPYSEQVKAFNFMLAYQFSRTAFYEAVADGEFDIDLFQDGPPSVVAPYDSNTEKALAHCFDRRTGKPVPSSVLASYREVLADYHLHSESKFHNGELYDRGATERVHVEVISVEYIGKEANRLEEQFFLGEMPDAQIEYGHHPEGYVRFIAVLLETGKAYGMERLATEAGLSRQQLHAILYCGAQPKRGTIVRLCRAIKLLKRETPTA
jgi:hypothetical protein